MCHMHVHDNSHWSTQRDYYNSIDRCVTFSFQRAELHTVIQLIRHRFATCCSRRNLCRCPTCLTDNMFIMSAWQRTQASDRNPRSRGWVGKHASRKIHTAWWHTNTHINAKLRTNPQSQVSTHAHVHIRPQTHIDALWHSKMGRGAASAGAKQWTAFEPATSVTHPYWCQAEHSLTTQRFSKHSVAPGTVGVNGGKGGGGRGRRMDGWRDEWMDGGLTHGWKILPVKVLWWNNKETVRDSLQYVMPSWSV